MRLDERFRFDNLVVGAGNRLAVAAARAVAEQPGAVYNPLFIYGGTGLGKTHLLGGIGHLAEALQPGIEVEYVTLEEFVGQLLAATSTGNLEIFSARYERTAMLLIDDVQFLTGHREMQAELLKLFERMQRAGRQIVLTSDRPPSEIRDVDERLISRLSGGLIVDVTAPDYETRMAILRTNCEERNLTFKDGMLEEMAKFSFANVRELQGALNRLVAHQALGIDESKPRAPEPASRPAGEFENFLTDVSSVVQQHVESWQARLAEARQYWQGEGFKTGIIERALTLPREPDVSGLLATFAAAIEHMRDLERTATAVDPSLGGNSVFRDPERMEEAEDLVERALAGATPPEGPSPMFARDAFEVSPSNQLAAHAADAVVAEPGTKYNPLLFHGPSGVGKTHLLNAIGNALVAASGGTKVVACVHAQKFVDELIAAIQSGSIERWRIRYRHADALIIDDVQFISGKERTQDELFLLFNAIVGAGKQIVLTSDRAPAEIPDLEARLRSRFEGGLVVPIQAPDRALRQALIKRYLLDAGRPADDALVAVLSDQPVQSVREIIGVVNRLGAAADASKTPLNVQMARSELGLATPYAGVLAVGAQSGEGVPYDAEKVVWEWPDVTARLNEELR